MHGVGGEVPGAIGAGDQPLRAGVDLVRFEPVPLDFLAALVLAINGFEPAGGPVVVYHGAGEVLLAVGAGDQPLAAGVEHVILHQGSGDFGSALIQAIESIFLTNIKVAFKSVQRPRPEASGFLKKLN